MNVNYSLQALPLFNRSRKRGSSRRLKGLEDDAEEDEHRVLPEGRGQQGHPRAPETPPEAPHVSAFSPRDKDDNGETEAGGERRSKGRGESGDEDKIIETL
ncbi:hypothetical protein LTR36_006768 [Oleoguttula mirabilis]|uniref:Uncharacterized protein n=1 Tax=Oleoguttula mirabilis TaxID=1507867 RepID=A0AAV9JBS3_9PEZI|nr:hypothetical protein LTR36_006768 [Oleoguttula mirabilis]